MGGSALHTFFRLCALCITAALLGSAAGCAKRRADAPASPAPALTASAPAATSGTAVTASPSPTPSPTPPPNLLARQSGAILRAYPGAMFGPEDAPVNGISPPAMDPGPWVFVYELPGSANLTSVGATLPQKGPKGEGATAVFAASSTGPDSGFSDIATIASAGPGGPQTAPVQATARWLRVTVNRTGDVRPIFAMAAYGELAPLPASANVAGTYVQYSQPYGKSGTFAPAPSEKDPWFLRVVTTGGDGINGEMCFDGHTGESFPGTRDGRTWRWHSQDQDGTFIANDDASILIGVRGTGTSYWVRSEKHPKFCEPQTFGSGRTNVVVLQSNGWQGLYPTDPDTSADAKHFKFTEIGASLLDSSLLTSASALILNGLCDSGDLLNAAQDDLIERWVQDGHKLLIYDADMCSKPTHYAMLPYDFNSDNPGAQGAKGDRLIEVENDSLGTLDKSDEAHYFDPRSYSQNPNQLGDANTVTTHDPHWCGHLFGTNVNKVNGFMQAYALYGKGLIIFDGFDHDDGGAPAYRRLRMLELEQPIPADLPCTQKAALAFLVQPDRSGTFVPGKAATLHFEMEALANHGWNGHVDVTASGDFKASVTPASFDMNGGTQPLNIAVSVPRTTKAGTYAIIVNAQNGNGETAQATIQLNAAVPMKKQRRIRIYGIHFDVDKATIKPQSEPVIAQIAEMMKENPSWRFRVEGHTDSDGGYQHNLVLSQHRAQAVVDDLVTRYKVARSRLVPAGYGSTKPVAPNTTDAGKALNRRVELYRLNGN